MDMIPNMKAYVGIANAMPDSRMPRRFSRTMMATIASVVDDLVPAIQEKSGVEARFSTPAEVDTATVST